MPDVFEDPNVEARGMIQSFETEAGAMRAVGNAIKVAGVPEEAVTPPPKLGGDTKTILGSLLKYTDDHISRLQEEGVFGDALASTPQSRS